MLRATAVMVCLALVADSSEPAAAQGSEPRGLTFSQGGGFHYAPREHHVTVPNLGYHRLYSYGTPLTLGFASPYGYGLPMSYGWPISYGTLNSPGYYWPGPTPMSQMVDSPLMPPVNAIPANISPWGALPARDSQTDAAERPVLPSSAASTLKARNQMAEGDQHLREHQWQKAYVSYRQAVNFADDLAEAHLRYGIIFAILHRYDRAEMEFKRAVFIDPSLPDSEFTLEKLFGPDSRLPRMSIISRLADWVNEDITDPQRLYVLGVMLHLNEDPRASELFTAAYRLTDGASYVLAFLPKSAPESDEEPPQPGLEEGVGRGDDQKWNPPPAPEPAAPNGPVQEAAPPNQDS